MSDTSHWYATGTISKIEKIVPEGDAKTYKVIDFAHNKGETTEVANFRVYGALMEVVSLFTTGDRVMLSGNHRFYNGTMYSEVRNIERLGSGKTTSKPPEEPIPPPEENPNADDVPF